MGRGNASFCTFSYRTGAVAVLYGLGATEQDLPPYCRPVRLILGAHVETRPLQWHHCVALIFPCVVTGQARKTALVRKKLRKRHFTSSDTIADNMRSYFPPSIQSEKCHKCLRSSVGVLYGVALLGLSTTSRPSSGIIKRFLTAVKVEASKLHLSRSSGSRKVFLIGTD